jgi:hypothetical protein
VQMLTDGNSVAIARSNRDGDRHAPIRCFKNRQSDLARVLERQPNRDGGGFCALQNGTRQNEGQGLQKFGGRGSIHSGWQQNEEARSIYPRPRLLV